jgi:hypothetical protein
MTRVDTCAFAAIGRNADYRAHTFEMKAGTKTRTARAMKCTDVKTLPDVSFRTRRLATSRDEERRLDRFVV